MKNAPRIFLVAVLAFFAIVFLHNLIAPSYDAWLDTEGLGAKNPHHKNWLGK